VGTKLTVEFEEFKRFQEDHRKLRAELTQDLSPTLCPRAPEELFHYTSYAMEIVQTRCLRATNLKYSTDYTELRHGYELAQNIREELLASASSPTAKTFLKRRAKEALSHVSERAEVFGFSLSESKADLSQWRSYASNGTGHVVGFRSDRLEAEMQALGDPNIEILLLKVLYDEELQKKGLKQIIQKVTNSVEEGDSKYDSARNLLMHASLLAGQVAPYIVAFKREQFASEKEWRLVGTDIVVKRPLNRPVTIKFRKSGHHIVPFVEFRTEDRFGGLLPIKSIEVGSQVDESLGSHAAQLLLKEYGYRNVPVTKCDIPIRSF